MILPAASSSRSALGFQDGVAVEARHGNKNFSSTTLAESVWQDTGAIAGRSMVWEG